MKNGGHVTVRILGRQDRRKITFDIDVIVACQERDLLTDSRS